MAKTRARAVIASTLTERYFIVFILVIVFSYEILQAVPLYLTIYYQQLLISKVGRLSVGLVHTFNGQFGVYSLSLIHI